MVPLASSNLRFRRATLLFDAAEQLGNASAEPERASQLTRLELYRSAAYWGLTAIAPPGRPQAWPSLLLGVPLPERAAAVLTRETVEDDEARDAVALTWAVEQARSAAEQVFEVARAPERALSRGVQRTVVRTLLGLIAGMVIAVVAVIYGGRLREAGNLAEGKPWRASSMLSECHPAQIECGGVRTAIFFHTVEEDQPWVEIDLGSPTPFSKVVVKNRSDAVQERAVPLVLEVGDDQKTWKELSRRDTEFATWEATFEPVTARYVRLRSPRRTLLHLDAVRVFK